MNVAAPILSVLAASPSRLAIRQSDSVAVDYAGMRARIVGLAKLLQRKGLAPGDRVLLQTPQGICFASAAIAALLAGGVPVLCEPGLGDAVYLSRVRAASPRWILSHPAVLAANRIPRVRAELARREIDVPPLPSGLDGTKRVLVSRRMLDRLARQSPSASFDPVERSVRDDAVIVFTGGTTSMPKGVRLSHGALDHYLSNIRNVLADYHVERFLADTPQQVLYALRLGRSAFTTKGRKRKRAASVLRLVRSGQIDAYFGSPYVWVEMMSMQGPNPERLPPSLRTVLLGSAPVTQEFLGSLRDWVHPDTRILVLYGLTEVGPVSVLAAEDKIAWTGQGDLVGTPLPGIDVRIDNPVDESGTGEVVLRSPSMYSGYMGEPDASGTPELRTGDLGRLVPHCSGTALVLLGRTKDMIIRRGVNIYPSTLESTIRALRDERGRPLIRECALVGRWNEATQDEDVVLCLQPWDSAAALDMALLGRRIAEAIGPDAAPDHLLAMDPIPVTGRQNKVDKQAVRAFVDRALRGPGRSEGPAGRSAGRGREAEPEGTWQWLPGAAMPFGWDAFRRKYTLLAREEGSPAAVLGQALFRLALLGIGQTAWALDEVVAPGWRNERALGPIFILGHQRSGTTFLHRLLSSDVTHARALALHEMLLPAVSVQRGLSRVARIDERLGGPGRRRLDALQNSLFGPLDDIHRLRFGEVEEDEFVLWTVFESAMCANDAPSAVECRQLDDLRHFEQWPEPRQARALGYYRACLLKKLARDDARAGARWIVSKNPAFTHKAPQLAKVFPDARFVYLVRNPLEAIPSRLSLIRAIWRRRFSGFREMTRAQVEVILADSLRAYRSAERDLPTLAGHRRLTLTYDALIADPRAAVSQIYRAFGLPGPDDSLQRALDALAQRAGARRSKHRYRASEFGLDEQRIRSELAEVFERYRFA